MQPQFLLLIHMLRILDSKYAERIMLCMLRTCSHDPLCSQNGITVTCPSCSFRSQQSQSGKDIFDILGKLKVHDSAHNSPPLVPRNIQSQSTTPDTLELTATLTVFSGLSNISNWSLFCSLTAKSFLTSSYMPRPNYSQLNHLRFLELTQP